MADSDASQAVDAVYLALGWRGRYQLIQLLQLMACIFPMACTVLSIVFIGKSNEHHCRQMDNATSNSLPPDAVNVTYGECSVTWLNVTGEKMEVPCLNGLQFAQSEDKSMMSEWLLVCENEALTDVSQTLLLAGMMVGAVLFTSLADKYGRKPFHIGCNIGLLATGVALAFAPNFATFLPLRFVQGAMQQGTGLTSGILCMEILPARYRFTQGFAGSFLWALCMVLLALLAYLMRHLSWRYLQLAIAGSSLYCLLQIWFTDESLRWLIANGKIKEAERIVKKAAALNGVNQAEVLHVFRTRAVKESIILKTVEQSNDHCLENTNESEPAHLDPFTAEDKTSLPKYNLIDFIRHKYVLICILINGFAWAVNAMTYYGLAMTSVTLADNMYLGFFLSAVVELPTSLVFVILIERIGRKTCCDIFHVMAGLTLLASVTLSSVAGDDDVVHITVIVLSLLGKFAISLTFAVLFLYTPEQFPTNLRNASLGVASMAGRVGGMIAPYSRTLGRHVSWGPGTVFGVCCLLVPITMRFLPETCGRELPQTMEDMTIQVTAPCMKARVKKTSSKQSPRNT